MIDISHWLRARLSFFKVRPEGKCVRLKGLQVNRAGMLAYRAFRAPKRPKLSHTLRWEIAVQQSFKCRLCHILLPTAV